MAEQECLSFCLHPKLNETGGERKACFVLVSKKKKKKKKKKNYLQSDVISGQCLLVGVFTFFVFQFNLVTNLECERLFWHDSEVQNSAKVQERPHQQSGLQWLEPVVTSLKRILKRILKPFWPHLESVWVLFWHGSELMAGASFTSDFRLWKLYGLEKGQQSYVTKVGRIQ